MIDIEKIDAEENIEQFLAGDGKKNRGRHPNERYASFDYCFHYFQSFKRRGQIQDLASHANLQQSCLQLGFYLASWGMLRGSSFLLEKSARHFIPLIQLVSTFDKDFWDIDVDRYTTENIGRLLGAKEKIKAAVHEQNKTSDTLATKIMLGIFGNIPAFDNYFMKGLGFYCCKETQLKKISEFYERPKNKEAIDRYNQKIRIFDFYSGKETDITYTKAKVVDMIGFIEGQRS